MAVVSKDNWSWLWGNVLAVEDSWLRVAVHWSTCNKILNI